jgi:hypothetical protein
VPLGRAHTLPNPDNHGRCSGILEVCVDGEQRTARGRRRGMCVWRIERKKKKKEKRDCGGWRARTTLNPTYSAHIWRQIFHFPHCLAPPRCFSLTDLVHHARLLVYRLWCSAPLPHARRLSGDHRVVHYLYQDHT